MHQKLANWLKKLGIKDLSELRPDERATFQKWKLILSKEKLTIEDYLEFAKAQVAKIEKAFGDIHLSQEQRTRLVDQHFVYKTLMNIYHAPKEEKERLEKKLDEMIKELPVKKD